MRCMQCSVSQNCLHATQAVCDMRIQHNLIACIVPVGIRFAEPARKAKQTVYKIKRVILEATRVNSSKTRQDSFYVRPNL